MLVYKNTNSKGFTLIELLIVIAILGVLAVVVLLALNPVQQLARTRDAGRISAVTQLGHAIEAYATSNNGTYPAENGTWIQTLVDFGEIGSVPSPINYSAPGGAAACGTNVQNGFCYDGSPGTGGTIVSPAVVFARMESQAQNARCTAPAVAWAVYSTAGGRGGITCSQSAPNSSFLPANFL